MDFLTLVDKEKSVDYHKRGFVEKEEMMSFDNATTKSTKLLNALLEGNADPEIIEEMNHLELDFLIKNLVDIYKKMLMFELKLPIDSKPETVIAKLKADSFDDEKIIESFDLYILIATLADHNREVQEQIEARLQDHKHSQEANAITFMAMCTGNIEIKFH
mmetsp:Transcript_9604/g.8264  ORF Transcript_9604/g.8264 Transcript_9604/m.8264 type:complete len:161 (-) Transcript_9604:1538-2020(-)